MNRAWDSLSDAPSPLYHLGLRGFDWWFRQFISWSRLTPAGWLHRWGIRVHRNVAYSRGPSPHHRLDIYIPPGPGPHPMVLYAHGGGFSILSKDTHWMMAMAFARRGFLVANVNYRLAPRAPFPAALEDVSAALHWLWGEAITYGGDRGRLVLAGESAGANLMAALAVAMAYERTEPYARALFDSDIRARAVLPACGILQVSDPGRFRRRKAHLPALLDRRIHQVARFYLGKVPSEEAALADPLLILESDARPLRPMPPFFICVGTRDPLLDDSRRLKAALDKLGVPAELVYYPGGIHAFHALLWQPLAQQCWSDTERFLRTHLNLPVTHGDGAPVPTT